MSDGFILVVDDEEELRENMYDLLELEGFNVETAETGDAALALVKEKVPDLILLDIQLPGTDGIEVLRQVKEVHPNLPVIMVSASSQKGTHEKLDEYGADSFILKPYDQDDVLQQMNDLLAKAKS